MSRTLNCPLFILVWSALVAATSPAVAAESEAPRLAITYNSTNITIEWPLAASDWILEQAAYLGPSSPWSYVPLTLTRTNGTNITLSLTPSGHMFYRLGSVGSFSAPVPGLTANWRFDDGPSELAQDSSGHDNGAVLANVAFGAGRIGPGALWFNGEPVGAAASRAVVSNDSYRVLPSGPFTVSLWLNSDALATGWRGLIGNSTNGNSGWSLALHNVGPGTNEFVFTSAGPGGLNVVGRKLLLPGQWYELTATYDGSEGRIYVDSQLLGKGSGSVLANDQPIYFGGGVNNYASFLGLIDEVRIFTNALTHEEVSLTGNWQMNENGGPLVSDSSVRGRRAFLSGAGAWRPGKAGSGIDLSNSTVIIRNDYADVLPPTGGSFSLSFWLYPHALSADWHGLMSCANGTDNGWNLAIEGGAPESSRLRFWSTDSGGTLDLSARIALPSEAWTKIDLTFNGGIATLYVNGLKVHSSNGGIQGSTVPIMLGAVPGLPHFNGAIDELKIYRRERDETEIGPVAKVMWETVFLNSSTNLVLQGFGPLGKTLTYSIVDTISPTNGTITLIPGSGTVRYTAGSRKGPDAFAYNVSDGEFTTPATIVAMSVVQPHWLSPTGGGSGPPDGSSPGQAWAGATADALDAIWHTNNYYDCFFYGPGEYQTRGWHSVSRRTAGHGCKHVGSGFTGSAQTTIKLVMASGAWNEGFIFRGPLDSGDYSEGFEVHNMVLDCNAANNPQYLQGEPVWISIPLIGTSRVDGVKLKWDISRFNGVWSFGSAFNFSVCTHLLGTDSYLTNSFISTGRVDTVSVGVETDEIVVRLERRTPGVDFYSLAEVEVVGASISVPSATSLAGEESDLDTATADHSVLHTTDNNEATVWASGPEDQVRVVVPLRPGTAISEVDLLWNCEMINGLGQLGPAIQYRIQVRDSNNGEYYDVPFTRQQRTSRGLERNTFGSTIITDTLAILLDAKELEVDFYSLREIRLLNGNAPVRGRLPSALNSLPWGNYEILRAFDGDMSTQWASDSQGMCGAIAVVGANLKFTNLKIIGFGCKATSECFPLAVNPPTSGPPVGNILIEDCAFADPATNNTDGLTAIIMLSNPLFPVTNAIVRRCTVSGVKPFFRYSHAFTATHVENCLVRNCQVGIYFEPNPIWVDNVGPVLIRTNEFLDVDSGISLGFAAGAQFDSITCLGNQIVLSGWGGWGFAAVDTWGPGASGSTTNVAIIGNTMRFQDWTLRQGASDGGLYCSDIHNALFANNIIALGTANTLRLRNCPSGIIPPPPPIPMCDGPPLSTPGTTYPPCLDVLPAGYRRAWCNNRDLTGASLKVRYWTTNSDGFASQQQWQ
jgi:hypothetical protein